MKYIFTSFIVLVFSAAIGIHQRSSAETVVETESSKFGIVHNLPVEGMEQRSMDNVISAVSEVVLSQFAPRQEDTPSPEIGAPVALVQDLETGQILYEQNTYERYQLASITKLLTAATVMDEYQWGTEEWLPMTASAAETYGSNGFVVGESFRIEDLIRGLLLPSNNIAATRLAEHFGEGNPEFFMEKMNQKAQLLGMSQSKFVNPHGLDQDGQYSTAADIMILLDYVYDEYPQFWEIMQQDQMIVQSQSGQDVVLRNSNELVGELNNLKGGKTGFTYAALETLASVVTIQDRPIGIVVMQAPIGGFRFSDTQKLSEWVESNYELPLW